LALAADFARSTVAGVVRLKGFGTGSKSNLSSYLRIIMSTGQDHSHRDSDAEPCFIDSASLEIPKTVQLDTRIEMASWSFAQKDFELTTQYAEQVLEEVPSDPRALSLIAGCQILLGNLDAGIVQLNHAINCTAIESYEAAAEEAYEHMSFADDDTVEIAWSGFNDCIQFLCQPEFVSEEEASAWEIALERARACVALEHGQYETAKSDLKDHLRQFPKDTEARFELARAYFHTEEYLIASELLLEVLDEKPYHAFAASMLARIRAHEADFHEAIQYATQTLEANPQSCRARLDLVEYLYDNHDYQAALDLMADAPKCDCGWFRFLHARTRCYCQLERFESAMESCQQMLNCDEQEVGPEIDLELGRKVAMAHYVLLLAKIDGFEHAMLKLEQEADSLISDKWLALESASLYREYHEDDLAARLIECLSYEHPEDPDVILAMSIVQSDAGCVERERSELKRLVDQPAYHMLACLRLSSTYEREGQYKEALYWAFRGDSTDDSQGRVEYQVARVFCQLGSLKVSREFLDSAIECNSSFRGKAKADEVLTPLECCF
jgi:tetratricopeptide (TPR) repeat protein